VLLNREVESEEFSKCILKIYINIR